MAFAILALRPALAVLEPPQRMALMGRVHKRFFLIIWHAMPIVILRAIGCSSAISAGFAGRGGMCI